MITCIKLPAGLLDSLHPDVPLSCFDYITKLQLAHTPGGYLCIEIRSPFFCVLCLLASKCVQCEYNGEETIRILRSMTSKDIFSSLLDCKVITVPRRPGWRPGAN